MSLKLLILDMDGTLVDTIRDITDALNYALGPYGLNNLSIEETTPMVGEGLTRLVEKVLGNKKIQPRDEITERFLGYYSEHLTDNSTLYPGVEKTLKQLTKYRKAVISNKREYLSTRLLNELNMLKPFDLIVGSDTTPERKPSPVPVLYVCNKLGISPLESVVIGDSKYDIEAGKNAGTKTIGVTYGYGTGEQLKGADYIIDSFSELIDKGILRKIDPDL